MTHCQIRLAERNITIEDWKLNKIASHFSKVSSVAVLLVRLDAHKGCEGAYRSRESSNGDLVVLIVRDAKPITIMFRRSNQPFTAESLKVKQVVELIN